MTMLAPKFNNPKIIDDPWHRADMDRFMHLSEKLFGITLASALEGERHICQNCGLRFYPKSIGRQRVSEFCTKQCKSQFRREQLKR